MLDFEGYTVLGMVLEIALRLILFAAVAALIFGLPALCFLTALSLVAP